MIKIEENDFLWNCYKASYRGISHPPHPKNLCSYFWTAIKGILNRLFYDANIYLLTVLMGGVFVVTMFFAIFSDIWHITHPQGWDLLRCLGFGTIYIAGSLFSGIFLFSAIINRFNAKYSEEIKVICFCVFFYFLFGAIIGLSFKSKEEDIRLMHFVYGLLTVTGIAVAVLILGALGTLFLGENNFAKNFKQYCYAVKNKACPLVDPPDTWKEKEKEKNLNLGDG